MKAKDGAEEGQTADMVALAEGGDLRLGDGDGEIRLHGMKLIMRTLAE
jgi:hypothetical protein